MTIKDDYLNYQLTDLPKTILNIGHRHAADVFNREIEVDERLQLTDDRQQNQRTIHPGLNVPTDEQED